MSALREKLSCLPAKAGVYLFKDRKSVIIYIGKAKSLRKRVSSYFKPNPDIKTSILLSRLRDIDYIITASELDALILESDLIKKYKPRYNVAQRDDKAYPFLKITIKETWPRLFLARKKKKDGALYFGRFQGGMVRAIIRLMKKTFPIRWCSESPLKKREHPCLYYHIGACSGPCVGKISEKDYRALLSGVILMLKGKTDAAVSKLEAEMKNASARQDFERAGYYRDSIRYIEKMMEGKASLAKSPAPRTLNSLEELKQKLALAKIPMRVECFDISNIGGSNVVGSMVAFLGGVPLKNDYRRFKIRSIADSPNDARAIFEVVARRYGGELSKTLDLPDLIIVDGGIAQVNFAKKALLGTSAEKIPLFGLAKKEELLFSPGSNVPKRLANHSPALLLLERIRDEAHRFAAAFHRERRKKRMFREAS